jgi:hypothetical protein
VTKAAYETWLVEKGTRLGKPYARRYDLAVPLDVARGRFERLSNLQLRELINDLLAERRRRESA